MATFQPDSSFQRRTRRRGVERRSLAAVLGETDAASGLTSPMAAVFDRVGERAGAEPATGEPTPPAATAEPTAECTAEPAAETEPAPTADMALTLADTELARLLAGAATEAHGAAHRVAEAATATKLAEASAQIAEALARAVADGEHRRRSDAALLLELVRGIATHVVAGALAAAPLDDLAAELPGLLARIEGPERVTIAVHPDLETALARQLDGIKADAGFTGELEVRGEPTLAPGDAVVHWPSGEAHRTLEARLTEATHLCAGWLAERDSGLAAPEQTPEETDEH